MLVIADNLTVANRRVASAVEGRDTAFIEGLVRDVESAGADMLDLNLGFGRRSGADDIRWLVSELAAMSELELCLDSANPAVLRAGLEEARNQGYRRPPLVNSFSLDPAKLEHILPLAVEFGAEIIGYCVREVVPQRDEERLESAVELSEAASAAGLPRERLYLDPILFPFLSFQEDLPRVLTFLRALPDLLDPPPPVLVGLSNISYGLDPPRRGVLEAAVLPLLAGAGLAGALLDARNPVVLNSLAVLRAVELETVFSAAALRPSGE